MTLSELLHNSATILPELMLVLTICAVVVADMCVSFQKSREVCGSLALLGTITATALLGLQPRVSVVSPEIIFFANSLIQDNIAIVFKLIFLAGASLSMLFSLRSKELSDYRSGEYYSLILGATLGACLLASANNFVLFIMALETLSMCSYILAGFIKHEKPSAEASLKYVLYGAVASGVMLFGISYLYGLTGSIEIGTAMQRVAQGAVTSQNTLTIVLSLMLVFAGLGFKIAMVPFHFWCPDVYQGSPTPVTAFLSVVSKAAGFAAFIRLAAAVLQVPEFSSVFSAGGRSQELGIFFGVLAVLTMTFGNLVALRQNDIKRLLAYSSIAHAGYLLLGLAVLTTPAIEAMVAYLLVYLLMNLGAFWVAIVLINNVGSAEISRFRGAAYASPFLAVVMFICLISLTGLPPTAGFVVKFMLFKTVVGAGIDAMSSGVLSATSIFYFSLALIGVLNSAVSLFYYMKIIKVMVFESPEESFKLEIEWVDRLYAGALALPLILLLNFDPLVHFVRGIISPISPDMVAMLP